MMDERKHENITRRLILSFCVLISVFLFFGLFSLYDTHTISSLTRKIYNHPLVVSNAALQANASIAKMHSSLKDVVLFKSVARIQESIELISEEEKKVYKNLGTVKSKILGQEGKFLENAARILFEKWRPIRKEVIDLVRGDQREEAASITIGKGAGYVSLLEARMLSLTEYTNNTAKEFMDESERIHSRLNVTLISFLLLGVIASFLVAVLTIKRTASAEKKLQKNESRFRELFEHLYDGVAVYTAENDGDDFRFVDMNQAGQSLSNVKKEDIIEKSVTRLFPGVKEMGLLDVFRRVYRTGKTERLPMTEYKDGRIFQWVDNTVFKLPSGEIVAVYRDESGRYIAQEKLKSSEERFRALFESMNEGVCLHALVGEGNDYEIIDVNPTYERITGLTREAVIGKKASALYGTGTPPFIDIYREVAERQKSTIFESYFEPMEKYFRISAFSMEKGKFATVFSDITEGKRIENEIRTLNRELEVRVAWRTAELQEANKDLEGFVYSVSHDLRAPLRSINGFSQIIARRHKACLNEEGRHYFDNIVKASERMGVLIEELLNFSCLGRKALAIERIDLGGIFESMIDSLQEQMHQENARINLPDHLPVVFGDCTLMTQTFMNLIDNGIKYHQIGVNPVIDIGFQAQDDFVEVTVADNGIGIDRRFHEKIFSIFQRLHREEDYPGTGIGLAVVKKAVQMMGGTISVQSEFGKGSLFKIKIPRKLSAEG